MYTYYADIVDVHDGDTVTADVDLGFNTWVHGLHFRIAGISARELRMDGGPEARDYLAGVVSGSQWVTIRSTKLGHDPADVMSFDRYVIAVQLADGRDLAGLMVTTGWAAAWDGKTRPVPYPPWPIPEPPHSP
jgi:endonuclease YncB( thermonuclease family)